MIRVLFVCLGNICRSPMAEAVMRDMVKKEHLEDKIEVDSALLAHGILANLHIEVHRISLGNMVFLQ